MAQKVLPFSGNDVSAASRQRHLLANIVPPHSGKLCCADIWAWGKKMHDQAASRSHDNGIAYQSRDKVATSVFARQNVCVSLRACVVAFLFLCVLRLFVSDSRCPCVSVFFRLCFHMFM